MNRIGLEAAGLALALLASPASAQQGEPIGSWWLIATPGPSGHTIMTLSTQGSGVVAFRCEGAHVTVLLGLNRPQTRRGAGIEAPSPAGAPVVVEWQVGAGPRTRAGGVAVEETVELDEAASERIVAEAAEAPSFTFHLAPGAAEEVTLVFRPVETRDAVARLRAACAKGG